MILHSVEVRNARVLSLSAPMIFDSSRINIVHGPNGSGKSTLFETMRVAFVAGFNSSAASLTGLQPWQTDAAPYASIVFEHGGVRYRLSKQFLVKPFSKLEIAVSGADWRPHQAGKGADDLVRGFLRASGTSDTGLLSMLWTPQGELPLTNSLSGNVLSDVRLLLGAQVAGKVGVNVEKAVQNRWDVYFTETGRLKRNGPLSPLVADLDAVRGRVRAAQSALDQIDCYREKAQSSSRELAELLPVLESRKAELITTEMSAEEFKNLRSESERAQLLQRAVRLEYSEQSKRLDHVTALRIQVARLQEKLPKFQEAAGKMEEEYLRCSELARQAAEAMSGIASIEAEAKTATERLQRAGRWLQLQEQKSKLSDRIANIERLQGEIQRIAKEIAELAAPDSGTLQVIRKQLGRIDQLQTKLDALALRMEVSLEGDLPVDIMKGTMITGEPAKVVSGIGEIELRIGGVARIRVTGPHKGAGALEESLKQARAEFENMCQLYRTADIELLSARAQERQGLEAQVSQHNAELRFLLENRSVDSWVSDQRTIWDEINSIAEVEPEWCVASPRSDLLKVVATGLDGRVQESRRAALETLNQANTALRNSSTARDNARNIVKKEKSTLADTSRELRELEADGLTFEQRADRLDVFRRKAESADNHVAEVEGQLKQFDPKLPDYLTSVGEQVQHLAKRAAELKGEIRDADAAQRALLQQSAYTDLTRAEEQQTALEAEIATRERERDAIQLLHDLLAKHREEALRDLPGPIAIRVSELIEDFAGKPVGRINLTKDFLAASVIPAATSESREIDAFSGGEQEQIHLALRLALADHCAAQERQLMVLDDSLLNTDYVRLKRVLAAVEQRVDRLQFVILTCHPERYQSLGNTNWISLEQRVGVEV